MAQLSYRVLAAESDSESKIILEKIFLDEGLEYEFAASADKAFKQFNSQHFDVVISEMNFGPGMTSGEEFLFKIRESNSQVPFILVSDPNSLNQAVKAINYGIAGFLVKPIEPKEAIDAIQRAMRFHRGRFVQNELLDYSMSSNYQAVIQSTEQSTLQLLDRVDNLIELVYPSGYGSFPDLKMAIYEALSNAVEHGNKKQSGRDIFFEIELKMDRIVVQIKDEGQGFDASQFFFQQKGKGLHRGLKLIAHLMDEVTFNLKGNEINMLKLLPKVANFN